MILWLALFLLVLAISFILALLSMKGYYKVAPKLQEEYALFLIRKTPNLNQALLNSLRDHISALNLIISIERLFKGQKSALAIFGPKAVLERYGSELDLLELEDYSLNFRDEDMHIWEVGIKNSEIDSGEAFLLKHLPALYDEEQFLWQVVFEGRGGKEGFKAQIRAALHCSDSLRRSTLARNFEKLSQDWVKIPGPISKEKMISFWRLRSLNKEKSADLHPEKIITLVKI